MINSVYFLPHGMQVIPDLEKTPHPDWSKLDEALKNLNFDADTILLITPHGNATTDNYLIYNHDMFQGLYYKIDSSKSVVHGKLHELKNWKGNSVLGNSLLESLHLQLNIIQLTQGGESYPMTLAWGETVPLYYADSHNSREIVVLSIPRKRYDGVIHMKDELIELGKTLVSVLSKESFKDRKVALIISGDLAHTHIEDGPYGYHDDAKPFDTMVQQWVKTKDMNDLDKLISLDPTAKACGMAGMCILQGVFNERSFQLKSSFYQCPTYFGMIVAQWG